MERDKTFPCPCGKGDVVRRTSASSKNKNRVYYACPDSKPKSEKFGCNAFLWEDELNKAAGSPSSPGSFTPSPRNFPCPCGKGDMVRRTSGSSKNKNRVYYACPYSKREIFGCNYFLWEDELNKAATGSSSSSPGPFTPSPGNFLSSSGLGEANCPNCKLLSIKVKMLEAKLELALNPEDPSQSSAALQELIAGVDGILVGKQEMTSL